MSEDPAREGTGTDVVPVMDPSTSALQRAPIIDSLNPRQLALLKAKSPNLNNAELAQALELAWAYQLDPYANEIWFTKSRGKNGGEGKLLIMVGRDGLRRIAQRNGLEVEGDVVAEKDEFSVARVASPADLERLGHSREDFQRLGGGKPFHLVQHVKRGVGVKARGPVVGAWCRVTERKTGVERGYFDAGMEEYDQSGRDSYGPWNKQKSAMMLGACERQAIRQATPLGGLLAEGEDAFVDGAADELPAGPQQEGLPPAVAAVIERARALGHVGLSDVAAAQMATYGQPEEQVAEWVARATAELKDLEDEQQGRSLVEAEAADAAGEPEPADAEVVPPAPAGAADLAERIEEVQERIAEAEAADERDEDLLADLSAELDSLRAEQGAQDDPDQPSLLG